MARQLRRLLDSMLIAQAGTTAVVAGLSVFWLVRSGEVGTRLLVLSPVTALGAVGALLLRLLSRRRPENSRLPEAPWYLSLMLACGAAQDGVVETSSEWFRQLWWVAPVAAAYDLQVGGRRGLLAASLLTLGYALYVGNENLAASPVGALLCGLLAFTSVLTICVCAAYLHHPGPVTRRVSPQVLSFEGWAIILIVLLLMLIVGYFYVLSGFGPRP